MTVSIDHPTRQLSTSRRQYGGREKPLSSWVERAGATAGIWPAAALGGLGGGVVLGAAVLSLPPAQASIVWLATVVGRLSAVAGTYLALCLLVLAARVAPIERHVGHDRLIAIHKRVGPWSVWLIALHVCASVFAWSLGEGRSWWSELWQMSLHEPWILPADAAVLLLIVAGITSWQRARRRLPRQIWWTIHLYTYLAIALAFAHQITVDGPFLDGWARTVWIGIYVVTVGIIVVFRLVVPLLRSRRHDLRVAAVVPESPSVTSVWISGRDVDALRIRAGQFALWRFWTPKLAYEAHAYSYSAPVSPTMMRISIKNLGDASALASKIQPGTRVLMEGPYGIIDADRLGRRGRCVLIAGGIGVAPVRALAEELAWRGVNTDVIIRASHAEDLPLQGELQNLAASPYIRLHTLIGHRDHHPMDADEMRGLVPDIAQAEVYLCGPQGLVSQMRLALAQLRVPHWRIHLDDFDM